MEKRIEIYYHDAQYARDHGELDVYRASHRENEACRYAIERAISQNFDGFYLNQRALDQVLEQHTPERIALVLAITLSIKDYDGRFSRSNRQWAGTILMPDVTEKNPVFDRRYDYAVATHPAVLDGFVDMFRTAISASD